MRKLGSLDLLISIALVATLYGQSLVGLEVTGPAAGAVAMGLLVIRGLFSTPLPENSPSPQRRRLAALLGGLALFWCTSISMIHWLDRAPTVHDLGLLGLECGAPLILVAQGQRRSLLYTLGLVCTLIALADAVFNAAVLNGWTYPIALAQRVTEFGEIARYPGLSGNTLAAGSTAMVACIFLGERAASGRAVGKFIALLALAAIFLDLQLIDARRYLAASAGAVAIMVIPWLRRRFPIFGLTLVLACAGLWFSFSSHDVEEILRGDLMAEGWRDAQGVLWLGQGVMYRPPPAGGSHQALWEAGVTESGFVDLILKFGLLGTGLFVLCILIAICSRGHKKSMSSVLVAAFAGMLPYSDFFTGFFGAIAFFTALLVVIFEEPMTSRPMASAFLLPA
jgi:hypothetical protein